MSSEKYIIKAKRDLLRTIQRDIRDEKVIRAMQEVPRELFVPPEAQHLAYLNIPVSIGEGQTISQPLIVAFMTSLLELRGDERVMELGTGSGYQAAVLSRLVPQGRVLTLERIPRLAEQASTRLQELHFANVEVCLASGELGARDRGPFDAIIVTAATPGLPVPLVDQIAVGGRMVVPIGSMAEQDMARVVRTGEGPTVHFFGKCRFVPLIGDDAWPAGTRSD